MSDHFDEDDIAAIYIMGVVCDMRKAKLIEGGTYAMSDKGYGIYRTLREIGYRPNGGRVRGLLNMSQDESEPDVSDEIVAHVIAYLFEDPLAQ